MITWQRSFRTCKRSWQASKTYQNLQWKPTRPTCRCGDCSWHHRWKRQYIWTRDTENLEVSKNSEFEDIESLFNITKKLVSENSEIRNVNYMDSTSPSWTRSILLSDRALKWTKAKSGDSSTMERPSNNFSDGKFSQWATGMTWSTNWIRVENSPRIHSIADSSQNPKRPGGSTHRPRRVQW